MGDPMLFESEDFAKVVAGVLAAVRTERHISDLEMRGKGARLFHAVVKAAAESPLNGQTEGRSFVGRSTLHLRAASLTIFFGIALQRGHGLRLKNVLRFAVQPHWHAAVIFGYECLPRATLLASLTRRSQAVNELACACSAVHLLPGVDSGPYRVSAVERHGMSAFVWLAVNDVVRREFWDDLREAA
jgi:hypothetical protein